LPPTQRGTARLRKAIVTGTQTKARTHTVSKFWKKAGTSTYRVKG
jgi:hypothetical protein